MRTLIFLLSGLLIGPSGVAQRRVRITTYSAASAWTPVFLAPPTRPARPAPVGSPASPSPTATAPGGYKGPVFTGDFVTNRNGWRAGSIGSYQYQIGTGVYNVRKRVPGTNQTAFSFVPLPAQINLNLADYFTIKADVVSESGRPPVGGIAFGVSDSLTYTAFQLDQSGQVSIRRLDNGRTSSYMPGDYFNPNVVVNNNRNQLTVRRKGDFLHFYINENEIRTSPYPFNMLGGNGVGIITNGDWTSFQKLSVTLDAPTSVSSTYAAPVPAPAGVPVTSPAQQRPAAANAQRIPAGPAKEVPAATPGKTNVEPTGSSSRAELSPVRTLTDTFRRNERGWLTGKRRGYEFDIANGSYSIRRLPGATQESGRCYINLPATLNLNTARSFTISVEMTTAPGQTPQGGLLLGVQNVDNLVQFALADQQQVVVRSLSAGRSQTGYLPGKRTPAGVSINPDQNKLTVTKQGGKLFFSVNGQEISGSPYEFKPFTGNGIGFIAGETDIKLQNLVVQVEP